MVWTQRRSKPIVPTEHAEQQAVFQWAELAKAQMPELGLLFAIPNGGVRHWSTAAKLKAEGVKPGVPDICLPVPRRGYHGLWIEVKRIKGRLSLEQLAWLDALTKLGYRASVCFGADQVITEIKQYLQ